MKPQFFKHTVLGIVTGAACLGVHRSQAATDYVAHEWGTFTSIQGADGALLDWSGVETAELPPFVYNWSRPGLGRIPGNPMGPLAALTKSAIVAQQRLETPVIYFYTQRPLRLDVAVSFPLGHITEWFPQARDVGPSTFAPNRILTALDQSANRVGLHPNPSLATRFGEQPVTNSVIHWSDFEVLPAKQNAKLAGELPTAQKASHYFAARETESAFVRVASLEKTNSAPEREKFLFYRGVGNFPTPLNVTISPQEEFTLANRGGAPLKHLFALAVHGDRAAFVQLGQLDPAQTRAAKVNLFGDGLPRSEAITKLSRHMADALVTEGLYPAEAEAMVKTWRDAWFEEQGVRILYVLPRSWTDQLLPITLDPQPRQLVRVMVGRAELITPGMESEIRECIVRFRVPDESARQQAVRRLQAMGLGRFATPAMVLATRSVTDQDFRKAAFELLQVAQPPRPAAPVAPERQATRRSPGNGG